MTYKPKHNTRKIRRHPKCRPALTKHHDRDDRFTWKDGDVTIYDDKGKPINLKK